MITEALLVPIFGLFDLAFAALPDISWTVDTSAWQYGRDILSMVCYMLPMQHITAIVDIIIGISVFRLIMAMIKSFLDFVPFF